MQITIAAVAAAFKKILLFVCACVLCLAEAPIASVVWCTMSIVYVCVCTCVRHESIILNHSYFRITEYIAHAHTHKQQTETYCKHLDYYTQQQEIVWLHLRHAISIRHCFTRLLVARHLGKNIFHLTWIGALPSVHFHLIQFSFAY